MVKSEPLCHFHILPCRICTTYRCIRRRANSQDLPGKTGADILRHVMCMWSNKPRQGASRSIRRKLFCKGVIEKDSIFPCRHRGMVSPWLRLQSCGLLSSFFMFSLFDVVSLGGLLIQSSSLLAQYCSQCVSFYKFSLYSGCRCWTRAVARNIPFT